MSAVPQGVADAQNPWPGLNAFDETSARFFNGRDTEAAELARLVLQGGLTVLYGKSGLGKTSLLQAGLFPRVRERDVLPVYVRLDVGDRDAPLIEQLGRTLEREVGKHGVQMTPAAVDGSLWERLHRRDFALWSATNRPLTPLFVLDQFEEVFTLGAPNRDAIERLRIDLADLVENRIPASIIGTLEGSAEATAQLDVRRQRYKVLLSFREDFLPDVDSWRREIPSLVHNRLWLREMNGAQAFDAVYQTGSAARLVDERTAREIVLFVGKIPATDRAAGEDELARHAVEPALLSLVCSELNRRRQSSGRAMIDAELIQGSAESIISDFYARQVAKVPPAAQRFIEEELVTENGFRSSFPVEEALKQGVLTETTLATLIDSRLLRIEQQLGLPRVELTHDRLTDVVRSERDKRRGREQLEQLRKRGRLYGVVITAALLLISFASVNYVAKLRSDRALEEARKQRAIAQSEHAKAVNALADAEAARRLAEARLEQLKQERQRTITAQQQQQRALDEKQKELFQTLEPEAAMLATLLIRRAAEQNLNVRLLAGYRSPTQQAEIYASGRTVPGLIRTAQKYSSHNTGLAFDIAIYKNGKFIEPPSPEYTQAGQIGQKLGLVWGGSWRAFRDWPHFETPDAAAAVARLRARGSP